MNPSTILRSPRLLTGAATLWLLLVVLTFSDAGVSFPVWLGVGALGVAVVAWLAVRLILTFLPSGKIDAVSLRGVRVQVVLAAAILATGTILATSSALLCARLYLSSRALQESATMLSQVPPAKLYDEGRRVGLFRVRQFSQSGSELRFMTSECGLIDTCGLVFSPDGPPTRAGEDSFTFLFGPWRLVSESF